MEIKIIGTRKARNELRTVNLNDSPETRWNGILREDKKAIRKLLRQASADLPPSVLSLGAGAFGKAYETAGGLYSGEIQSIADWAGYSFGHLTLLQCSYELSHTASYAGVLLESPQNAMASLLANAGEYAESMWRAAGSIFGCSCGVVRDPRLGMLHLRNMDWALSSIKGATRLIRFTQKKREFVAVGIVGFVGILSGMVPGAYSVTLNYAPPSERPGFDFGPAFLLRHVLETCDTMKEAVRVLSHSPLATSAFFTICDADDAITIERTRTGYGINCMVDGLLTQSNHHQARNFKHLNDDWDEDSLEFSIKRQRCMERKLKGSHKTMAGWAAALRSFPIYNTATQQSMIFAPATGRIFLAG